MLRYPPMTEGYIFLPRAVRPEVKKYIPRSEVDHLSIYTDKEVVLLYNFDLIPPLYFLPWLNSRFHFAVLFRDRCITNS